MGSINIDTPFVVRCRLDKSGYEIVKMENEDWRECVHTTRVITSGLSHNEALRLHRIYALRWIGSEIYGGRGDQFIKE